MQALYLNPKDVNRHQSVSRTARRICASTLLAAIGTAAALTAHAEAPVTYLSQYRPPSLAQEQYRLAVDATYRLGAEFQKARVAAARTGKGEAARPAVEELARKPFARDIEAAAAAATIDPALVHAVIQVESGYHSKAVSPKGARGLMQVMPQTGARYGVPDPGRSPKGNLKAGTLYLRDLMRLFEDRLELVIAAYNAGENAVQRHANRIPPYRETQHYVRSVLAQYDKWRGRTGKSAAEDAVQIMNTPSRIDYWRRARTESLPGILTSTQ